MRSFGSTFLLALVATLICGLAAVQWHQGSFDLIFGKPPTPVGEHLYRSFKPQDVKHIEIKTSGTQASFTLEDRGWQATRPWQDRMDPVAAVAIIQFTLGMRVEDLANESKVDPIKAGLGDNAVQVRLTDANGEALAHYKLGRVSEWKAEIEGADEPVSTLFVQTEDPLRQRHVYLCTGDITPLFNDGLRLLRDHRPLYFNPLNLEKITIHSQQGDLTLGRKMPQDPWRIIKPLDLPTDIKAIQRLLEGLYNLRANKISERNQVTLPAISSTNKNTQISIARFGSELETKLEIFPSESFEDHQVKAIVSDRPNTVFYLPLKPSAGVVSLADLPLDVNALRDPTLTHVNVASLSAIAILPSTGREILISRQGRGPWMAGSGGISYPANEQNLYRLLKAVTSSRAIGFESDAASDFSPWGLDRPVLTLRFLGINNQSIDLHFGINLKGEYFVNRLGTPTVMKVDPTLIHAIALHFYEWKHAQVWSLNRVHLTDLVFKRPEQAPLMLKYDFIGESWEAEQQGRDLSAQLIPSRANFMLSTLEGIKASRWLAIGDEDAIKALTSPSLSITAMEKTLDEDGNPQGVSIRTLTLAPVSSGPDLGSHYGMLNTEPHPFLIDAGTYQKITTSLFED